MTEASTGTAATSTDDVPTDGRRARRHRSRDLAVDALLDLLYEGVSRPTAHQVAERSGVSLRSIFRIFEDVQSLHVAAVARHLERVGHLFVDVDGTGTLKQRTDQIVATTTRVYEAVAPVRRAALRVATESEPIQAQMDRARAWLCRELARAFGPELAGDDADLAAAVELALSFEAWDQLRHGQGLSKARTAAVRRRSVLALFGAA